MCGLISQSQTGNCATQQSESYTNATQNRRFSVTQLSRHDRVCFSALSSCAPIHRQYIPGIPYSGTFIDREMSLVRGGERFELRFSNHAPAVAYEISENRTVIKSENGAEIVATDTYVTRISVRKSGTSGLSVTDREISANLAEQYCKQLMRKVKRSAFETGIFFPESGSRLGYWYYSGLC